MCECVYVSVCVCEGGQRGRKDRGVGQCVRKKESGCGSQGRPVSTVHENIYVQCLHYQQQDQQFLYGHLKGMEPQRGEAPEEKAFLYIIYGKYSTGVTHLTFDEAKTGRFWMTRRPRRQQSFFVICFRQN